MKASLVSSSAFILSMASDYFILSEARTRSVDGLGLWESDKNPDSLGHGTLEQIGHVCCMLFDDWSWPWVF
ncbi:hypothetical protein OPV22_017180 [Ensete ventricosum]|uniref:Secreted protein n=1 Tax=Ensete ventricosum TaxID=4639 RepID=A0AAV8QZ47_ENSVE|nr:hypothetical protein OPV22_017180 [Ensete ventricosum]